MRILVLGAGAVGGTFGAALAVAGADVTFLVRPARARALAAEGLRFAGPDGERAVPIAAVTRAVPADLVLLTCKAYDLAAAIDAVAPAVGPDSVVVPLLNGISHMARLEERFGAGRVLGGLAHIGVTLRPDGVIQQLGSRSGIRFGPLAGRQDRWSPLLHQAFRRAEVDAVLSDRIEQDMWEKFVFIATMAGITCLLRSAIGTIVQSEGGPALVEELLSECGAVAAAEGFAPGEEFALYRSYLGDRSSPLTASMLRDMERGGPTEADHILGDLVARAARHGIATPVLRIATTNLQVYELNRRSAG